MLMGLLLCNAQRRVEQVRRARLNSGIVQGRMIGDSTGRIFSMQASICRSAVTQLAGYFCVWRVNGGMRKRWSVWRNYLAGRMGTTNARG